MKKIVVIGSPGAGKTTFAQELGVLLQINPIHLDRFFWQRVDRIFWKRGWKERPRDARIRILDNLVQRDHWIIEGTYLSSSNARLYTADTIIFLDMPRLLCLRRLIKRHNEYRGRFRPDLPDGCTDKFGLLPFLKVLAFPYRGRKLLLSKIRAIRDEEKEMDKKKTIIIFSSEKEIVAFLQALKGQSCFGTKEETAYDSAREKALSSDTPVEARDRYQRGNCFALAVLEA